MIVTGYINLNSLKWMRDNVPATGFVQKLKSMIDLLFEKIIPHGLS